MEHQMLSLADQVFDVIERDILNGTLERGEYLTETALSDRLGVSRTPVRGPPCRRACHLRADQKDEGGSGPSGLLHGAG